MEEDFNIDPEAGIPASEPSNLGRTQGRNEGSGEGWSDRRDKRMQYYEQVGKAMMRQAQPDQMIGPSGGGQGGNDDLGISNFNREWLADALAAGSANGAHL